VEILEAWGRKSKALAALPEIDLTERLGQYGLHLQRLARGATKRELISAGLPTVFRESEELKRRLSCWNRCASFLTAFSEN